MRIRGYMGDDWAIAHLTEFGRKKNKSIEMFGNEQNFKETKYFQRTRTLAEMFYNFQRVEGIKEKAKLLTTEDIESALAELEGAKMLLEAGRKIRFVVPSNQKGKDYDVETYMPDGTLVACEMKCKTETTVFSDDTIAKTIKKANDQLPKDIPSTVFMKIPGEWVKKPNFAWIMSDALGKAFNHIQTTCVVYFHWELWEPISSEDVVRTVYSSYCTNPNARIKHPELELLVKSSLGHYKKFSEII
jgi:hypothetical protein